MPEELNKINETTDYEKFKFLDTNRQLVRSHVESLSADIAAHPEILRVQPILVNENFFIIDGQHRFTAAKELKLPVYYTVVPGAGMAVARRLNVLQRGWKTLDFARSYANSGNSNYQFYLDMIRKYNLNHTIIATYIFGKDANQKVQTFRRGEMEVVDKVATEAEISMFAGIVNLLPVNPTSPVNKAFKIISSHKDFDYDRLVQKLQANQGSNFYRSNTPRDYIHMFEDAYNWNVPTESRVRLF
jgi:hypothetical protein